MTEDPKQPGKAAPVEPLDEWAPADAEVLRNLFLDEAEGHLHKIEDAFYELSRSPTPDHDGGWQSLDDLFRALHTLKGAAGSVGHSAIAIAAHDIEDLCAEIRSGQLSPTPGILDRMAEELGTLKALVEGARQLILGDSPTPEAQQPFVPPSNRRRLDRRRGDRRLDNDRRLTMDSVTLERISEQVGDLVVLRTRIERRLSELDGLRRELGQGRAAMRRSLGWLANPALTASSAENARRAVGRLGELELELASAISHLDRATTGLLDDTETLRRNTDSLDETLHSVRLVSMDWLFRRMELALEELQVSVQTPLHISTEGGDLQIDRTVLDHLFDPLLHLLRNAVVHGIESPEERHAANKSSDGKIEITGRLEGDFIFLTLSDDGRGVDEARVRDQLVRSGRLGAGAELGEEALLEALFEPGFSTREKADALSGRGMGLSIVQTAVAQLGGRVTCATVPGKGTTFTLCVPLVAAITQGLLFKLGGHVYAMPIGHVVAALPPLGTETDRTNATLESEFKLPTGQMVPVLRLQGILGLETPPDHRLSLLHVRFGQRPFVITCDKIIGPRTVVVRPLGPILSLLPYFSGATVSGAGKLQLVLDVAALAELAYKRTKGAGASPQRGAPRVLIVDDSRLAREAAARALAGLGLQTLAAEDGWEAWELLNERRFDLVVTDLEMPRVDGFALIARIRRDPTLRRLPIVVLSSRTSAATQERARRLGASAVVVKAPHRQALARAVQRLLAETRREL
ncbi:MAG: response regulator [Deltaproteobacteria bacterium]|nr:response regulator [Deltaproteobacteria bacterium]